VEVTLSKDEILRYSRHLIIPEVGFDAPNRHTEIPQARLKIKRRPEIAPRFLLIPVLFVLNHSTGSLGE